MNASTLLPGIPQPFVGLASRLLSIDRIEQTYATLQSMPAARPFHERLIAHLDVTCKVADADLKRIPRTGAVIVTANHPTGILDGAVLATLVGRVRADIRILATNLLQVIPELRELLILVDPDGVDRRANARGLREAVEFLNGGGCLIVFPAGAVSHLQWPDRAVGDSRWHSGVARLVEMSTADISIVPAHLSGSNSALFQVAGVIHPLLRTAMLPRELLNKRRQCVEVRFGSAIESAKLREMPDVESRVEYLRWRTDILAGRNQYKPRTSLPLARRAVARVAQQPVETAIDAAVLEAEISRFTPLTSCSDLSVYLQPASEIPNVLREIGRLRETTFRAAGEGTGNPCDLDEFDDTYLHLFVWNPVKREVVGAYRMAGTDRVPRLYTSTLFPYDDAFRNRLGLSSRSALELGRSFIRAEYQRGFTPLLALWKGIGKYVAMNPRYRVLFGPVSISNSYRSVSRELMVSFLENCLPFARTVFGIDDLSKAVSDLEPDRAGIPVLLRQYLRLGGKLFGFNVDPHFSNALDGLILVDLAQTEPKLLKRYFGEDYSYGTQ